MSQLNADSCYIFTDTELKREMLSNNLRLEYSVHKIANLKEFPKAIFNLTPVEINSIFEISLHQKFPLDLKDYNQIVLLYLK